MKREYRITMHPHFKSMGNYHGERFFPQYRNWYWFIPGDWQDLAQGSLWRSPRGVPTKEQAEEYVRDDKLNHSAYERLV